MRKKLAIRFAITLTLGLYLIFTGGASITLAENQPDGSTIISPQTTDGTWGPGTLTADTDVVINARVAITIAPGTTIQVEDGVGFTVNGELHSTGPVTFTSIPALPGAWEGITFAPGSSGSLDQTIIEFAQHALTLNTANPITVTNSTLRYNHHQTSGSNMAYGAGLYIQQGDHLIQNTHVHDNAAIATGTGEARGAGIYIASGSPHIFNSWIYENTTSGEVATSGGGISVAGGAALIESSHILTNTVTGGGSGLKSGGGIGFLGTTDAVVSNSWIAANQNVPTGGYCGGGGIGFVVNATASRIEGSIIYDNYVAGPGYCEGAGIDMLSGNSLTIVNNLIANNTYGGSSGGLGGGLNMNGSSAGLYLINNTIVGNSATQGGGVHMENGINYAFNNAIFGNNASYRGGGLRLNSGTADYNDAYGNTAWESPDYSGTIGANNLNLDPLFVNTGDLASRYQLRQGSPLIDAGTNSVSGLPDDDYDGTARPIGASWDIGFDEVAPFVAAKSVDLDTASGGMSLVYTLIITNPDPGSALVNGQITDVLPPDTAYDDGPTCNLGVCAYNIGGNEITWAGNVPGGSVLTLTYTVQIDLGLADGTEITNRADVTVSGDTLTTDPVTTMIYNPVLSITKSAIPEPVEAGERLDYTIVIHNSGLGDATGVTISDPLPDHTQFILGSIALDPPTAGTPGSAPPDLASDVRVQAGERVTVTYAVTVDQPLDADTLITNIATFTSVQTPTPASDEVQSTVSTTPAVSVFKDGPGTAQVGQTVVYTFTVTNVGNTLLRDVQVVDDYVGPTTFVEGDDGDGWLDLSEAWIYTASHTVLDTDPNPLVNTVTVTAVDALDTQATAQALHTLDIQFAPALSVVKDGPNSATVGQTIVYTFSVSNDDVSGDGSPVRVLTVSDDVAGDATYLSGDDGDGWLQVGEAWVYTVSYTVLGTDPDPLENEVTVTGEDQASEIVTASDTHSTDITFAPALTVIKDGPDMADVGENLIYTFTVTNDTVNGDGSPIHILTVSDDVAGDATYVGGDDGDGWLQASETWVYTASHTFSPDDPNPLANEVTITGQDRDGDLVSASDTHSTFLATPTLSISKDGPAEASVGERVVFTFTVTNDGAGATGLLVHDVQVNDNIAGNATFLSGDDNEDDWLDADEIWIFTADYLIQPNAPAILKNTGTVTARDQNDTLLTASDIHTTTVVFNPVLALTKDGPHTSDWGETVAFTFTMRHARESDYSPVRNITVNDDVAGAATYVSGDNNNNNRLDAAETWTFSATYTIQSTDPDPLVNTATAQGQDSAGETVVATATHTTALGFVPVLALSKDGPSTAYVNETVTFTFTLANDDIEGDSSPISNLVVTDDVAGDATYLSGDANEDGLLQMGEAWVFGVSYTIQSTDTSPLVNTATATGTDQDGAPVSATDAHSTAIVSTLPVLALSKDGPSTAYVSETVTFTFTLTNDDVAGDGSPMGNLAVTDDVAGDATYLRGDANQDGLLQVGETWFYTASYTIQSTDPNLLVNTATATGTDRTGAPVSATDTHSTEVKQQGQIEIYLVYLPLVAQTPAPKAAPDLVVEQITATANNVTVVIKNQGDAPVTSGFWVDLYIDPRPAPTMVNQTWDDGRSSQGMVWGVTDDALALEPGASFTLTVGDAYYWPDYSNVNWPLPVGTPVYVQVDSADVTTDYGAILEDHEMIGGPYNNISGPVLSTADAIATQGFRMTPHMFVPVRPDDLPTRP